MADQQTPTTPQLQNAPVTLDFSKAQPIDQKPQMPSPTGTGVTLDFSKAQPIAANNPQPSQQPGFLSTLGSDVMELGKGIVELPGKAVAYAVAGQPDQSTQAQLEQAQEAHKSAVYKQFSNDIHAGNYSRAFFGLRELFNPHYDDQNDPLSQMMTAQWDSSARAKQRMIESAKKGDTLGVIQHSAGVLPIASQVDAAMTAYQNNPTRQNLAHIVSAAIPAFVPELAKGVSKVVRNAAPAAAEAAEAGTTASESAKAPSSPAPGVLKPGYKNVAGVDVPVRADSPTANAVQSIADTGKLKEFEINKTQPAVRQAVGTIAADVADTTAPVAAPAKADAFGLRAASEKVASRAKAGFQKLDELSGGEFSKAQNEADLARSSLDFEGKKAYQAALDRQNAIFDKYADKFPESDLKQLKADWRQKSGLEELSTRFNRSVGPTPADLTIPGKPDLGYVNPVQFRNSIIDAIQNGEFEKAGFAPEHVQTIEDLGRILEKSRVSNPEGLNAILGSTLKQFVIRKAVGGAIGGAIGGPVGALAGMVGEHAAEWAAGKVLGSIMTDLPSVRTLAAGIAASANPDVVSQKILEQPGFLARMQQNGLLTRLWKEEHGELGLPGTVGDDLESERLRQLVNPQRDTELMAQARTKLGPNASLSQIAQEAARLAGNGTELAPTFFSKAEQVANQKIPNNASGDQILATLRNNGVKDSEIEWLGLDDYLKGKPKVSKADLQQYINDHKIQLNEVNLGGPASEQLLGLTKARDKAYAENNRIWSDTLRRAPLSSELFNAMNDGDPDAVIEQMPKETQDAARRFVETDQLIHNYDKTIEELRKNVTGETKYGNWTLPGNKSNYTEKLLTLPAKGEGRLAEINQRLAEISEQPAAEHQQHPEWKDEWDRLNNERKQIQSEQQPAFDSPHFDQPNILAHVRYDDRIAPDGKKVLLLEEVQSDLDQLAKQQGYTNSPAVRANIESQINALEQERAKLTGKYGIATDADKARYDAIQRQIADLKTAYNRSHKGAPDAPFKNSWHELVLKRMLRHAAENGYDRLAWTTGEQQAERYDLSRQVSKLEWHPIIGSGDGKLWAFDHDGNAVMQEQIHHPSQIADYVGKDAAQKLLDAPLQHSESGRRQWRSVSGVDLKVGGDWAKALYDRAIPRFLNQYAKKWGAKVGETSVSDHVAIINKNGKEVWDGKRSEMPKLDEGETVYDPGKVHSIEISPAMKKSVLTEGQPIAKNTPNKVFDWRPAVAEPLAA